MSGKWTPGPWIGGTWEGDDTCEVLDDNLMLVARTKTEANAHLIAAAPDLYEALEQARDTILELINARNSEAEGSDEDWVGGINAALSKARGENQ